MESESGTGKAPRAPSAPGASGWGLPTALIAIGALVHAPAVFLPFIYDDRLSVLANPNVRRLWPLWEAMSAPAQSSMAGRPMVSLSLALNHALAGGLDSRVFHAFNVLVHLLCALVLYGIVRRTLDGRALRERFGPRSRALAFVCTLLWMLHPIQTECVAYVTSRTETLMALFYLLTLYAAIRCFESPSSRRWVAIAVLCCALGMASKEAMATAPLLVLLYDQAFHTRSFAGALRSRRTLYAGLAACWGLLLALTWSGPRSASVGFGHGLSGWSYFLNQCAILVDYLRLVLWPHPLLLDYGFARPLRASDVAPQALLLTGLFVATAVALLRRPMLGFLGAWCFVILGPTSSFVPIWTEIGSERRMYLPLAALVVLLVLAADALWRRVVPSRRDGAVGPLPRGYRMGAVAVVCAVSLACAATSIRRYWDYRTNVAIWRSVVRIAPDNSRGHFVLATELADRGKIDAAIVSYRTALELRPENVEARVNLGNALLRQGKLARAIRQYSEAANLDPEDPLVYQGWGSALLEQRRYTDALEVHRQEVAMRPDRAEALGRLAWILATHPDADRRDGAAALEAASRAVELTDRRDPHLLDVLAAAYAELGRFDEAVATAESALELSRQQFAPHSEGIWSRLERYRRGDAYRLPARRPRRSSRR